MTASFHSPTSVLARGARRAGWLPRLTGGLLVLAVLACAGLAGASPAAADPCVSGTTIWANAVDGDFSDSANWTNGSPSPACDANITLPGDYTVSLTSGAEVNALTLGGLSGTQTLTISSAGNPDTNLRANAGITNAANGAIVLDCPALGCGFSAAPALDVRDSTLTNAGTVTVTARATGAGGGFTGTIVNTGTLQIDSNAHFGAVTTATLDNQGTINLADGATLTAGGSSCGDASVVVTNGAGGQINGAGSGNVNATVYNQGDGTTTGGAPVVMSCGTLNYTGAGAGSVLVVGGVDLTGATHHGQSLTLDSNGGIAKATAAAGFANGGAITLDCPIAGCTGGPGAAPSIDVRDQTLTNSGSITVTANAAGGGGFAGSLTNTGTLQIDGDATYGSSTALLGMLDNQGVVQLADGATLTASGSSCSGVSVIVVNNAGGQIKANGSGTVDTIRYDQGDGTTTGTAPVTLDCGALSYSGSGASSVLVTGDVTLAGDIATGQQLTLAAGGATAATGFTNAGTITLDTTAGNVSLGVTTGNLTNTGTIETVGAGSNAASFTSGSLDQADGTIVVNAGTRLDVSPSGNALTLHGGLLTGGGTISGSVANVAGTVNPALGFGELTISGNYEQGAAATLAIEAQGVSAPDHDRLVVGGDVTLGGALRLVPKAPYIAGAAQGDSLPAIVYQGTRVAATTFSLVFPSPGLAGGNTVLAGYDDPAKQVNVVIGPPGGGGGGGNGGGGGGGGTTPPPGSGSQPPPAPPVAASGGLKLTGPLVATRKHRLLFVTIKLFCDRKAAATCSFTLALRPTGRQTSKALGSARTKIRPGKTQLLRARLSAAAARMLVRKHTLKAGLELRVKAGAGAGTIKRTVTLKAPKRQRRGA